MSISFEPWLCSWPDSSVQGQGFPRRFWPKWCATYKRERMLHIFSGSSTDGACRIDIRPNSNATLVGDFRDIKLVADEFNSAFADPPYTQEFADEWGVKCPTPSEIQRFAFPALKTGGIFGILHLQVVRPIKGFSKVAWHPVFCGTTKHIRCLSVFRKEER